MDGFLPGFAQRWQLGFPVNVSFRRNYDWPKCSSSRGILPIFANHVTSRFVSKHNIYISHPAIVRVAPNTQVDKSDQFGVLLNFPCGCYHLPMMGWSNPDCRNLLGSSNSLPILQNLFFILHVRRLHVAIANQHMRHCHVWMSRQCNWLKRMINMRYLDHLFNLCTQINCYCNPWFWQV